jgi:GTP-binding protein EngB required for normal cell division
VELDPSLAGDWERRALADVASPRLSDLLAGASKVSGTLRLQNEWTRWLSDTIGSLKAEDPRVLDAVGCFDAPILTTNYDDLLERRLNLATITARDKAEQVSFARLDRRDSVLHVHGCWRQPDTVVLDIGDYARIVGDALAQAGLRTMGTAWSLVFIGCGDGLSDPNFEQFLGWMSQILGDSSHRHFRLERAGDVSARQAWHNARGHRIRVLPFGEDYGELPQFLETLSSRPGSLEETEVPRGLPASARTARPKVQPGEYARLQESGRAAVRKLCAVAAQLGFESVASHGAEIAEALERDLYRVAITGRSRAGKSTLLNALVRRDLCPVERVITTAIPLVIGPGDVESATVTFEKRAPIVLDGPVAATMLAPYADQRYNPNNAKGVERIDVHVGHEVLDLGVQYIDIPGFDDPSGRIWSATNAVIQSAHALILVVDVSTYEDGGFAIDRSTRDLLQLAGHQGRPVLVVCNKADKLSAADKLGVAEHLREELERHGLGSVLRLPPFVLSARAATKATAGGEPLPAAMQVFEEALWDQLWSTEAAGLRRLYAVFSALQEADDEMAALLRVRMANGPERDALAEAIAACRRDLSRIRANAASKTRELRALAARLVELACADYLRIVSAHIASLPAEKALPTVSSTVEALKERRTIACRDVLTELDEKGSALQESVRRAITRSLADVCRKTGAPGQVKATHGTLESLSRLIDSSGFESSERAFKLLGAGFGTAASVGFALGGPVGWLVGGLAGILASAFVDHLTDVVDTREVLLERVSRAGREEFSRIGQAVGEAIGALGTRLDNRIEGRMQPFLGDMERKWDAIREPSAEELSLHEEAHRITGDALAQLVRVFGGLQRPPVEEAEASR